MATTINFSGPLLDSDNNPALDASGQMVSLGKLLSNEIMGASINDDPMKYFIWALDIRRDGSITLEDADKARLVNIVTSSNNLTVLGKGRLIEIINGSADDSTPTAPVPTPTPPEAIPSPAPEVVADQTVQQVSDISNTPT